MFFTNWPQQVMYQLFPMRHMARDFRSESVAYGDTRFSGEPYSDITRNSYGEQLYDVRATYDNLPPTQDFELPASNGWSDPNLEAMQWEEALGVQRTTVEDPNLMEIREATNAVKLIY